MRKKAKRKYRTSYLGIWGHNPWNFRLLLCNHTFSSRISDCFIRVPLEWILVFCYKTLTKSERAIAPYSISTAYVCIINDSLFPITREPCNKYSMCILAIYLTEELAAAQSRHPNRAVSWSCMEYISHHLPPSCLLMSLLLALVFFLCN